ncbi:exosome complex component rrp45 [Diaphorina citri]|uniref:Exosome complex component RRP45 n=1 Tax=Diaphorina citri TaxID=121845 RepID=A0A1S3DFG9_DIACI|nr:exosome complex component rrp45 [Diaphorina citri]
MREFPVSNLEKSFVLSGILQNKRLDGRRFHEFRKLDINFGREWGSCMVSLGETKVLAQVSCNMVIPKATRPNEGLLFINAELSPMASPQFETGRQTDTSVMINRFLEKCFKESKCIDLESLCVVAEEKVWNVRVDLNVLNYDGNLLGCCSIAALAALAHFRHPDVTSTGDQIIIHSAAEKDPIPMTILHYPVTISYAVFNGGEQIILDPTSTEEGGASAQIILAVNSYREICGLHLEGAALADPRFLLSLTKQAAETASVLVTKLRTALENDAKLRSEGSTVPGFTECIQLDTALALSQDRQKLGVDSAYANLVNKTDRILLDEGEKDSGETKVKVEKVGPGIADLISKSDIEPSGIKNQWVSSSDDESSAEDDKAETPRVQSVEDEGDEVMLVDSVNPRTKVREEVVLSGDSEEEDTVMLTDLTPAEK